MRIATWNVNGIMARLDDLLRWLDARKPDIVALQKIKVAEKRFPTAIFESAGYCVEKLCDPGYAGVAVLSRKRPRLLQKGLPGQEKLDARLLTVEVDGLEFSSVYAPFGKREDIGAKLAWFGDLAAHLEETRSRSDRRVLCGDFNVVAGHRGGGAEARGTPLSRGQDIREKFNAVMEAGGLCDLYAVQPPDREDPFMFEDSEKSMKFSRLEYVLGTQRIVDRTSVIDFDIDHARADNGIFPWARAPIIADLRD